MSVDSESSLGLNIYEEDLNDTKTCNLSNQAIEFVPEIENRLLLCVLYLQNNKIKTLPDEFFPSLPALMYLDLRDNILTDLPVTIQNHQCLTHLLLQNNKLTSLPNELGSVVTLKVLQLAGNPLMYPPREIIMAGTRKIITYLHEKYIENIFARSQSVGSDDAIGTYEENHKDSSKPELASFSSVHGGKLKCLSVQFSEKELYDSDEEYYAKIKGKCPKLPKSRTKSILSYTQSAKYLNALRADNVDIQNEKIKIYYLKERALKKHKELMVKRDKILQERKNAELLKKWRQNYRHSKQSAACTYRLDPKSYPYDTNPDHMTFLTREDIEKDLPDKYKRRLLRKSKLTVPRKTNNDVHLAMKIKQLFENLEAIDLNREGMTPRTEQKVLLNEIQKISEIKQKLMELSTTNTQSVEAD
ncbi:uncharacterized protein LOC101741999 isoform X1 [Bombyx mori]|uniref:Leucine-rich repeat-containing protein 27 n=1 Tax=Bombyx mori TaxID=7091 RepID=A0A8R2AMT2_BOMMO|nr:uncharacterized protein LOC101741999 isoform X1 [Bombyx mori]